RSKLLRILKREIFVSDKAKARWNTVCIPSAFNAVRREKILFKTGVSLICAPKVFSIDLFTKKYYHITVMI
ncbi:MAG: hypothetical protein J5441_03495, partial [Clostridia bacterium]|nr:hypothetical protein [Clostridia bacterium]